jgi:hypothetical protein
LIRTPLRLMWTVAESIHKLIVWPAKHVLPEIARDRSGRGNAKVFGRAPILRSVEG